MTMTLVSTVTVGSGGASTIEFASIPATGTDILIVCSVREASTTNWVMNMRFNNDSTAIYTSRRLQGNGSTTTSQTYANGTEIDLIGESSGATANTFGNAQIYIPNYAGATNKSVSAESLGEDNATLAYTRMTAGIWASTAAISNVKFTLPSGNFAQYSTASLYTITKGNGGASVS